MTIAEKVFRIFSLGTLAIGFMVSVAGANSSDTKHAVAEVRSLVEDIKKAQEVNHINAGKDPLYVVSFDQK